jgi:hypothetical protein
MRDVLMDAVFNSDYGTLSPVLRSMMGGIWRVI